MKGQEFIKKYNIKITELRIYNCELSDEIWRIDEMKAYIKCEVQNVYDHNGDTVIKVSSIRI